jgi:hypothetical protein
VSSSLPVNEVIGNVALLVTRLSGDNLYIVVVKQDRYNRLRLERCGSAALSQAVHGWGLLNAVLGAALCQYPDCKGSCPLGYLGPGMSLV